MNAVLTSCSHTNSHTNFGNNSRTNSGTTCPGHIHDGYCDVCGLAPDREPPTTPVPKARPKTVPPKPAFPHGSGGRTVPSAASLRGMPSAVTPSAVMPSVGMPSAGRLGAGRLGAGLIEVPPVPYRDPESAVMADPQIAEHKRFCGSCDQPVGRGRAEQPGRASGFCGRCGTHFSFLPKLAPGDLVAAQYEVLGCLAHGGTGWVYLARDRSVSGRWVALKGMLGSADPDLLAASVAERRVLAAVEHPNIVQIHNFVRHFGEGYIVMEYVGGRSLKEIVLERRRAGESPPLAHVLAYGLEALRALGHLHDLGLLYCDFKPDNAIHSGDRLKLIDLGGVRRIDDAEGPVYGTVGYQAPEIADYGPSIGSDLYTVARTMAVLSFEFTGYTGKYRESLPDRDRVRVLARNGSYDRLLRRGAHPDPAERFGSAAEMAEQVAGVLAEVLAAEGGPPQPRRARATWTSGLFEPGTAAAVAGPGALPGAAWVADVLPAPVIETPEAGAASSLALSPAPPLAPDGAVADPLRLAVDHIANGDHETARPLLEGETGDWRYAWYLGICALLAGEVDGAVRHFARVHALVPGETAPKLALGLCAELRGRHAVAARRHESVWRTDPTYLSAAFGLARAKFAQGDRNAAAEALTSVPESSRHYTDAQAAAIVAALAGRDPASIGGQELVEAAERLERLELTGERHHRLTVLILRAALDRLGAPARTGWTGAVEILGIPMTDRGLRSGLERGYRALARLSDRRRERVALVELANAVRPKTVF
ncbi:tetratricopeptide repeat protein [Actinomadura sp. 9N407]|uniref:tetratricopeptide repeat protein n=1 Tax=Actinomadura sp. 9N407 TaxID=3375154 RepID=UPI00379BE0DF